MNDIEKAAANGVNIDCGNENEANASLCKVNFTLEKLKKQGQIAPLLRQGKENALSISELQALTGFCARHIKELVRQERQTLKLPILSSKSANFGYFLPADGQQGIDELTEYRNSMLASLTSIRKSLDFVAPYVRLCSDQFDFSDLGQSVGQSVEAAAGRRSDEQE